MQKGFRKCQKSSKVRHGKWIWSHGIQSGGDYFKRR